MVCLRTLRVLYLIRTNTQFSHCYILSNYALKLFYQEIENLKNIFLKNGYPVNFTDFYIKKYLNDIYVKNKYIC